MGVWKKITIVIIFLLFIYILFRLIKKRSDILSIIGKEGYTQQTEELPIIEGFEYNSGVQAIIKKQTNTNAIDCSMPNTNGAKPLSSFFVKSSFHSAVDSKGYVSIDMVRYVLSRGYRFLDFAVAYTVQDDYYNLTDVRNVSNGGKTSTACVGYLNPDSQYKSYIPLSKILDTIQTTAFTAPSPNPGDPIFIQIRPMNLDGTPANITDNPQLYTQIQAAFGVLQKNKIQKKIVTKDTLLSKIMGKIVIVMEPTSNTSIDSNIGLYIGNNISTITSGLLTDKDTIKTDTKNKDKVTSSTYNNKAGATATIQANSLVEIKPMSIDNKILNENPNVYTLFNTLSANFIPMMAWYDTTITQSVPILNNAKTTLGEYEELFSSSKSAFVDLKYVKTYSATNVINNPVVGP